MHCPECNHEKTKVLETRKVEGDNIIRRTRECANPKCEHRWATLEIPYDSALQRALGVRAHLMQQRPVKPE